MKALTRFLLPGMPLIIAGCATEIRIDPDASIKDSTATVIGQNHIGISVTDLDTVLGFYLRATGYELVGREKVSGSKLADELFGRREIVYETAVLKGPNMLLELTEFSHNKHLEVSRKPAKGPGMTHTCFQSPSNDPGWAKFMQAGATSLTRGGEPVDLGGYGVTYGYAYDPEGNMIELEQLDKNVLEQSGYDAAWGEGSGPLWMSQVALATHDLERLLSFYAGVLGFLPYRTGEVKDNVRADKIVGLDNMHALVGWFRLNEASKRLEIWQYVNPVAPQPRGKRDITAPGYSFSLEVSDIQAEYRRMSQLGVEFISQPVKLGAFWQVYARDPDGNPFSLRQAVDPDSRLSVRHLDSNG